MRPLLKFAAGTTLINLMTAAAALLRGKLAAVILGTAGVGLFGQVDSFYRGLVQICILSTGTGVTRCIAELHTLRDDAAMRRAFWSITAFSLALSGAVAVFVMIWSRTLSRVVLSDGGYGAYLAVVAVGLPLQAVSDIVLGMLIGLRDLRAQLLVTAAYTGGGALLYAILIFRYGIAGAVYSVLATAACSSAAAVFFLRRGRREFLQPRPGERHFDTLLLRFILAIGLSGGLMAISERGVLLVFRSVIIRRFGFEANGLYQAVYSLSQLTIAMAFGFVGSYLVPTLSGLQDSQRISREAGSALRLTLLISTIFSAVMILYGKFVLEATYSSAFLGALPLLRFQALGDFGRALMMVLNTIIFAVHGWKPWFGIGMSFYAAYILFFGLLLPVIGFRAIAVAYLLAYCVAGGLAAGLFPHYTKMNVFAQQGPLLLRSVALLVFSFTLAWLGNAPVTYMGGAAALLLWARLAFSSSEYRRFWGYISNQAAFAGSSLR
jgi:O-antigen/teichoic acid export membrane protein